MTSHTEALLVSVLQKLDYILEMLMKVMEEKQVENR